MQLDPGVKARCLAFQHKFYDLTKKLLNHGEAYQNDVDEELTDYLKRFFGDNLPRLLRIKKIVDPDNYFYNPQSIPPLK